MVTYYPWLLMATYFFEDLINPMIYDYGLWNFVEKSVPINFSAVYHSSFCLSLSNWALLIALFYPKNINL